MEAEKDIWRKMYFSILEQRKNVGHDNSCSPPSMVTALEGTHKQDVTYKPSQSQTLPFDDEEDEFLEVSELESEPMMEPQLPSLLMQNSTNSTMTTTAIIDVANSPMLSHGAAGVTVVSTTFAAISSTTSRAQK